MGSAGRRFHCFLGEAGGVGRHLLDLSSWERPELAVKVMIFSFPASFVLGGDVEYAVGVCVEGDLDLGHTVWGG